MPKFIDLTGKHFGYWTVLGLAQNRKWYCLCTCGVEAVVRGDNLRSGISQSCGCRKPLHRNTRFLTPEYRLWGHMKTRCSNPRHKDYAYYGARGIRVCDRWQAFENFLADIGERPRPTDTLERINNDGDYEPNNVRWATRIEQALNRRPKSY